MRAVTDVRIGQLELLLELFLQSLCFLFFICILVECIILLVVLKLLVEIVIKLFVYSPFHTLVA